MTLKLLVLALCLHAVGALKIVALISGPCSDQGFQDLTCSGVATMAAKYPNDDIKAHHLRPAVCESSFAPGNTSNYHLVIMVGFYFEACALKAAEASRGTWVVIVDHCPDDASKHPNLICALFAETQPSYVAGYLAGLISSTKVVGAIGGVPIPPVQRLLNGFSLGVKASCADCRVESKYVNSFYHPDNAVGVATHMVDELKADVVYGCGGGTGTIGIEKAAELGSFVIGVDIDEFKSTFAGKPREQQLRVVTSVLKRVDVSVEIAIQLFKGVSPGDEVEGLAGNTLVLDYTNNGVAVADCHLACGTIGRANWAATLKVANQLAANVLSVPVGGFGWSVPLVPADAKQNAFYKTPALAKPPAPRIQAAASTFNAWLVDYLVFFGGKDLTTTYNDLWLYNIQAALWINGQYGMTKGTAPPAMAKSCAMSFGVTTYIFGGRSASGSQSNIVYAYEYQPSFLGFSAPTSPFIINTWSNRTSLGDLPPAVEGPGCTKLDASCAIVYGGRQKLAEADTVHRLCLNGTHATWTEIATSGAAKPTKRESMGITVVANATKINPSWPGGKALVVAGGLSMGNWLTDVWLLPLDSTPEWKRLPDLPRSHRSAQLISHEDAPGNSDVQVLVVQPTSAPLGTFTFDPQKGVWNSQKTIFGSGLSSFNATEQPVMVNSLPGLAISKHMWLFGGTIDGVYQDSLLVSSFVVQTTCLPGERTQGVGCVPCGVGFFSRGGVGVLSCDACASGRYAGVNISSTCGYCPAGRYGNRTEQSECPLCPSGTYKSIGDTPCDKCPAGSYGPKSGATTAGACLQCGAGKFTQGMTGASALSQCVDCPAGQALAVPFGKKACDPCEPGMYSGPGQSSCTRCPVGKFSGSVGTTECSSCEGILRHSSTLFQGATAPSDCLCKAGTYDGQTLHNKKECVTCTEGLGCDEAGLSFPKQAMGYYVRNADPGQVFMCNPPGACVGGNWTKSVCRAPRTGFLCMDCPAGKSPNSDFGKSPLGCSDCSSFTTAAVVIAPLIAFIFCVGIMRFIDQHPFHVNPLLAELQNSMGQLIMFTQVINAIFSTRLKFGEPLVRCIVPGTLI